MSESHKKSDWLLVFGLATLVVTPIVLYIAGYLIFSRKGELPEGTVYREFS